MSLIKTGLPNWPILTDLFDDDWLKTRFTRNEWIPAVNVVENEENYEIEMAAPGFKKEDFVVTIENGILTIKGKIENEEEEKEKNFTRREFMMKSFIKSFTLPDNVLSEDIEARYEDGVLRLILIKNEKELPPKKEVVIK
jgi:HSP20 family protein